MHVSFVPCQRNKRAALLYPAFGILESWEVGLYHNRDPPGFQHTLAVTLGLVHVPGPGENRPSGVRMGVCGASLQLGAPCSENLPDFRHLDVG